VRGKIPVKLSQNALIVLKKRYLKKDRQGKVIETPEEMFRRVAENVAEADLTYRPKGERRVTRDRFFRMMAELRFLPNSPTLMNAGRELQQLSACFVLPVEDSLESIFEVIKYTAIIHQSGGGTGFSFSRLRPKNDRVMTTSGVASGPVSFMKVFNMATEVIKQGGTRRGANMGILRVDHPDILEFITVKENPAELTNFNLSVAVTDSFMDAVKRGKDYPLVNPRTGQKAAMQNAGKIFDLIVKSAWRTGEPGIVFIDRINRDHPTPALGMIEATNPCGEQPLLPFESCNLGSINLNKTLRKVGKRVEIDLEHLSETIHDAVHFLDNVIDQNRYPLPQIEEMTRKTRKIGLGIMGFADILTRMEVPYDSEEALRLAERIMGYAQKEAKTASITLARERGVFPAFEKSVFAQSGPRLRNSTVTTIAPTGTLSVIGGCSSGIEPLYAISYMRTVMGGVQLFEVNPYFVVLAKRLGFYSQKLMSEMAASESIQEIKEIPKEIRRIFVTAHDISPEYHMRMQAAFQRHTDNAVSKTVNFRKEATEEEIRRVFLLAYQEGCKGVTIYRSGSREQQVLACINAEYC
jgi:ribonucleoside-diphosphate reductase alpha chain